jgi:hypothetical protein
LRNLAREDQQVGFHQAFSEAVDRLGKLGAYGSNAEPDERRCLSLGKFLKNDAADQLLIKGGETLEASLDVQNEDQCVFKGSDAAA